MSERGPTSMSFAGGTPEERTRCRSSLLASLKRETRSRTACLVQAFVFGQPSRLEFDQRAGHPGRSGFLIHRCRVTGDQIMNPSIERSQQVAQDLVLHLNTVDNSEIAFDRFQLRCWASFFSLFAPMLPGLGLD
jgi:hypothetical protein